MTERASTAASARDLTLGCTVASWLRTGPKAGGRAPRSLWRSASAPSGAEHRLAERRAGLGAAEGRRCDVHRGPAALPAEELTELLRPSGTFRSKSLTVQAFVAHLGGRYRGDLARMVARPHGRPAEELLGIRGIGPETADDILLYALVIPASSSTPTPTASSPASACDCSATATRLGAPSSWTAYRPT